MSLKFERALPSIVKSIRQRDLLNTWLRLNTGANTLPGFADFRPGRIVDELIDMVSLAVSYDSDQPRFIVIPDENVPAIQNLFLDVAMGPERYKIVLPYYQACLEHRRPIYSFAIVKDKDGKEVSYERLLLPFGESDAIEHIVGSFKLVNIEGGFKVMDLEKLNAGDSISITRAIIDNHVSPPGAGQKM